MERVADYIINRLYEQGVRHIFMVTGRGILYLSDAIAKHQGVEGICTHHEQSAAFAAISYTQASEKIGACLVSTGCAATNAVTGLLCAWQDNIPCVFISGQHKLKETTNYTQIPIRTYGSQEADIISIVKPLTKYSKMITDSSQIAYEMDKALYLANEGRKGPVWLDIPVDIQNMRVEPERLVRFEPEIHIDDKSCKQDIEYIMQALQESKRPTVLVGSGVRSANAIEELKEFVVKNHIPVTYANSAVDIYGGKNSLAMGVVSSIGGTRSGNFTVQNSDLLVVLGCRMTTQLTGSDFEKFARAAKVIVVDIDPIEHSKNTIKIDRLVIADVKKVLDELNRKEPIGLNQEWVDKCIHWKKVFKKCEEQYKHGEVIDLYYLAECISDTIKDSATILCDAGLEELIIPSTVEFGGEQRCIHSPTQGCMGSALPSTIGAYYGGREDILAVIGDGSIMMNLQELETIAYNKIPIKIIVVNNNLYSVIRTRQMEQFRMRTIGTDNGNGIGCPEFKKVAECFGIQYVKIEKSERIKEELLRIYEMEGPILCEVICKDDQKYLHSSVAYNARRRVVRRPIEDQSPYLEREIFLAEMVIDPIDQ